jgi:hypothetical protein
VRIDERDNETERLRKVRTAKPGLRLLGADLVPPSPSLAQHTVTFSAIPDVPVTRLTVSLLGGPKSLLNGSCTTPTGPLAGAFTGQNGKTASAQRTLAISGCSGVSVGTGNPGSGGSGFGGNGKGGNSGGTGKGGTGGGKIVRFRASGFYVSGIASGQPSVSFTLTRGAKAPKFKSFTITLPSGLTFVRRRLGAGIHIRPAHSLRLHNGRLTITLKRAVNSVTVRMGVPALAESTQLRRHPKRRLIFRVS